MSGALGVTRNAIRQHLAGLEKESLVSAAGMRRNSGRPSQVFAITEKGLEQFPKQYALLASLLLEAARQVYGAEGVRKVIAAMSENLHRRFAGVVAGNSQGERVESLVGLLNRLHYAASSEQTVAGAEITASSCVFQHLAQDFPEVCELDRQLLSRLAGAPVSQTECMATGGKVCRFHISSAPEGE